MLFKSFEHFDICPLLRILAPKQPDCTWLCARVTWASKVVESCSKAQRCGKSSSLHSKIIFWLDGVDFLWMTS